MFSKTLNRYVICGFFILVCAALPCRSERIAPKRLPMPVVPISLHSFNQVLRSAMPVPKGRSANFRDLYIRFYDKNSTSPTSYRLSKISAILDNPRFLLNKPTVVYIHGYVELITDKSIQTITQAFIKNGGYNLLVFDWSNLAFGNYVLVAMDVPSIGKSLASGLLQLVQQGVSPVRLHLVAHSLGAPLAGYAARAMAARGTTLGRVTALDPAFPGYAPPVLGAPLGRGDALFVDALHTDAGGFGAPGPAAAADFWPNRGRAAQPGCDSHVLPFADDDFCSHWRSWAFFAESVRGGEFVARRCGSYDDFVRGNCARNQLALMGINASPELRGNFYLRTAAKEPFALGRSGAD